jgi:hypothetical protein
MHRVLASRLASQGLVPATQVDAAEVVSRLGAVQSQDYPGALWALGLRLPGVPRASIHAAFTRGEFLRTHILRPTWHFVVPADIRWMLMLTAPRVKVATGSRRRSLGLTAEVLATTQKAIVGALQDRQTLTRSELSTVLRGVGIQLDDPGRVTHALLEAELDGLICSGPPRGAQQTYALLEERVAAAPRLTREQALAELTWRYFNSHGPALVQDCVWWSGLTTADVRRGLELNASRLSSEPVDGQTYWFGAETRASKAQAPVLLLPNYDEYTVAYRARDLYYDRQRNLSGNARLDVPFRDVIVQDGQVVGWWKRGSTGSVDPHWSIDPSPSAIDGLEAATRRYAEFVTPLT